ncbi:MAG: VanZ family protein [Bifidobacteriaceae bacterium]|jgi:glycopeptide antibiotics resistance protein|nr:VanZ family protein [Bifidobacteriaceae bacterium]
MPQAALLAAISLFGGLAVAVVAFGPFVALAYRRYKRLTWRYMLASLGFLIYFMAVWVYTLLFFPDPDKIKCVKPQLTPFYSVRDALNYPHGSLAELLHNPVVVQTTLNVALFIPLGVFVRVLWDRGVVVATLAGAGLSAFVETTQLTGVWGLYRCAYRVFDVDDIITNTTGALIGALMALALPRGWFIPQALPAGEPAPVTLGRRLVAMACDGIGLFVLGTFGGLVANILSGRSQTPGMSATAAQTTFWLPFAIQAACVLVWGRTLGDLATRLRWEPARPAWAWRRAMRFLGGIGGFQLLGLATGNWAYLQALFVLVALVAAKGAGRARGLPGLLGHQTLVDSRA